MGYSLSWLAIKGCSATTIQTKLGLKDSGLCAEFAESNIVGAALPSGWYLIVFDDRKYELLNDAKLAELSDGCEVLFCDVEEHVMCSAASGWRNGLKIWSVEHDSQYGIYHLVREGAVPEILSAISIELNSQQDAEGGEKADVDYIFDIPVELTKSFTGYRYDQDLPNVKDNPFHILLLNAPIRPSIGMRIKLLLGLLIN